MVIPLRDENPTRHTPVVTLGLIGLSVVAFFFVQPRTWTATTEFEASQAQGEETAFLYEHALVPCELSRMEPLGVEQLAAQNCDAPGGEQFFPDKSVLFSVVASMFLHGGLLHLGGNMLFLWIFGNNVEDRLRPLGYLVFYLVGGVAASLAHVLVDPGSVVPVIGASGAIAAVMGAYLVWWPHARILSVVPLFFLIQFIQLPAVVVLGLWFVLQFFTNPNAGVAWAAHVGGFVAGAAMALALGGARAIGGARRPSRRRGSWE
jgi:membrane associated rhomboid family serine protease